MADKIQEINWDKFSAKFSDNKQAAFERLCYLLFCKEFNKDLGIFRFRNHAGIETNPIEKDGQSIGWQAKFYTAGLSGHKDDFISSIDTTKARHTTVNKIIFYTNQEFGQDSKGTDPKYKIEIEKHAKSKGVEIEWRTGSYFESPFVAEQNFSIAQHFFCLNKGIIDSIAELSVYTESILKPIRHEITYESYKIKLDRSSIVANLKDTTRNASLVILSGGAGVGKTAVIKDLYKEVKDSAQFFVFKPTQLKNISHINQFFKFFGWITSAEFIEEHKDIVEKYIVFDSVEKLSELENQDVFREFLSDLVENGWKVIFTVRYGYLDDLRFQLKEFYNVNFVSLNIPILTRAEVDKISHEYNFALPSSERLIDLLLTPLYLSEYLLNYSDIKQDISYADFREVIWRKQILDSSYQANNMHRRREECFLKIARQRAIKGSFFVKTTDSDHEALHKLEIDEIIKFDSNVGGYFITHDVYEEWALDKILERVSVNAQSYKDFYQEIGSSLPIRRAFRVWLSDKLYINNEKVKQLIEFTIQNEQIDDHWRDEVLVSVLLSDYADVFFENFENLLIDDSVKEADENQLLHKILFMLRIACKTIDEDFLNRLGLTKTEGVALKTIFTVPRGRGWHCAIAFVNNHRDKLQFRYMNAILPVLDEWNSKNKEGETTKHAAQVALFYYTELTGHEGFYFSHRDDTKDKLLRIILNGSAEIKSELIQIVKEVVSTKDVSHRSQYYELAHSMLSSLPNSYEVAKNLPKEVINLANLFWFYIPPQEADWQHDYRNDIEQYFNLESNHLDYYPASAFQTPIFALLMNSPKEAVDFILSFTNKSIEYFAKTKFAKYEVREVDLFIEDSKKPIKQYISHRIWNIYRGTQVAPALLESMHMALERWLLLVVAKNATPEVLESWCLYLIKNSHSSSITAVVASVVLAESSKLFNVAKIIFCTKEFFIFDTARVQLDATASSIYSISHDPGGLYKNERLATCKDKHRANSLENLALTYQFFRTKDESEKEAKRRKGILWEIFDNYYAKLPNKSKEKDADKTWRLYLARMDRRKMKPTTENHGGKILINFNPKIDPELKKYSENSLKKGEKSAQYLQLRLWSIYRFEKNKEEYKKYQRYEDNLVLVVKETKEIIRKLKSKVLHEDFVLLNHSIPAYVCAILMRDFPERLNDIEMNWCKETLLSYIKQPSKHHRFPNPSFDGTEPAILSLPQLINIFPSAHKDLKKKLVYLLIMAHGDVETFAIRAILHGLWSLNFDDAHSIFIGYLLLKPKYQETEKGIREYKWKKHIYDFSTSEVVDCFEKTHRSDIERVISNKVAYSEIENINFNTADLDILKTAFELIPLKTKNQDHHKFMNSIFPVFSKILFEKFKKREEIDYTTQKRFLNKYAHLILTSDQEDIKSYLKPFLDGFNDSRGVSELFDEFVTVEDQIDHYNEFWMVWELFYPKVVALCKKDEHKIYEKEIIRSYLLAWSYWKESAKEWHTLKDREKQFFNKVSRDMGSHPITLYSLSKVLNDIGSNFKDDGIMWVSYILQNNKGLLTSELEVNTIYYIENLIRGYILRNRQNIKSSTTTRNQVLVILDFLIVRGSATGYLLREDIL